MIELADFLDRNIPFMYATRGEKVAWFNAAIKFLMQDRGFTLDELAFRRHRLRGTLEKKMVAGLREVKQQVFREILKSTSGLELPDRDDASVVFRDGYYAYDSIYQGTLALEKHFFPMIGNLKEQGEEFQCAQFIANEWQEVDTWVRNVERKKSSFWLPTATDKFYPDFVVRLTDGRLVVIEYKGKHLVDGPDSQEKLQIGKLWEKAGGGRGVFCMPSSLDELQEEIRRMEWKID